MTDKAKDRRVLLDVNNLKMYFPVLGGIFKSKIGDVKAVDGVSFKLYEGETLGLVGESGCGKSTTGKCLINLNKPTSGSIRLSYFDGQFENEEVELVGLTDNQMRPHRAYTQMIFQDPYSSLNPRMTVEDIIMEPLTIHRPRMTLLEKRAEVASLMKKVGLSEEQASRYPHEFSGGQRQRVGIARALATKPKLVIADEPVSALDVSIQAQVINLMQDLQEEYNLTYIFIAHDLAVVEHISDRIAVMYLGNIVEIADTEEIFSNPQHPYTRALLSAIPHPDPNREKTQRILLEGDVPSPLHKPAGCPFNPRCSYADSICRKEVPKLDPIRSLNGGEHKVACFLMNELNYRK
ncbi:MAG: ATP-binding cassette domain-containing protein [Candidatus Riflebacteria bacterium]|nr:ATP-binding cassette domain-containing protein [Candidatus Riflebacteria bacterium]